MVLACIGALTLRRGRGEPQPDGRPADIGQADYANRGDEYLDRRDLLPMLYMLDSVS
jgi:hypothetical protein